MANPYIYPRPEYPRPDFQRGTIEGVDWLNLNGPWQFRFDGDRIGLKEGWHLPDDQEWREQIMVPFCWESLAAWGEGDQAGNENYYATRVFKNPLEVNRENHRFAPRYEVGWYRRMLRIPASELWAGKRIILKIGAADFFTDGWCNGQHVGHNEGGYLPFEFDLTDAMHRQPDGSLTGLVVLRVEDPMDNAEQPVGKQWTWYTTTSGIWQTVYVEPRSTAYIDCCQIYTDIDQGVARCEVECHHCPDGYSIEVEITPPKGGELIKQLIPIKENKGSQVIRIDPLLLWNPNEPHLYQTRLILRSGDQTHDIVRTYFGMRKISTTPTDDPNAPEALSLNGVPRYLRGALHQSYYPEGVYTAGHVQTLINDISYAKRVGFNFLRIHIKVDDPLLLYHADRIGMLLMCDFPNFGEGGDTPLGRKRYEVLMRGTIKRDFNHPSIFAWCCFNETWGFGGQVELVKHFGPKKNEKVAEGNPPQGAVSANDPGDAKVAATPAEEEAGPARDAAEAAVTRLKLSNQSSHAFVQQMWALAKTLDRSRLIEDMSVVHWDHLDYYAHGETDINSWHFYIHDYDEAKSHIEKVVKATYRGSNFNYVDGFNQGHQPLINSEYGGVGALDGDRDVSWSFKFLTNELRRHGAISGYIYTELHDVEWEYNGFLNYDRTPKEFGYDATMINESDTLPINAPPIRRAAPGEKISVEVASSHYSTHPHKDVVLRWKLAGIDTTGRIYQDLDGGVAPIPFPHWRVAHAHTIQFTAPNKTILCTLSVEAIRKDDGRRLARNFVQFLVTDGYPLQKEETPRSLIFRGTPGDYAVSQWSSYAGERHKEIEEDTCHGFGTGYFEWRFPLAGADISKARRLRVLCEASSRRIDNPQSDDDQFPTEMEMLLSGVKIFGATLPNHPHDSRGALSYLRRGKGAYGYLVNVAVEGDLLSKVASSLQGDTVELRCGVPPTALAQNGLTIYGAECGRFPICPTLIVEW
ncbi:MAG: glycoside hydrolase family 2 protein [Verrucomicrobiales bacterium]